MQNQMTEKVIAVKQKIFELDKTQKEILNRMASYGRSGTSILTVASKDISKLEEHVSRVDTKSVEYASNLDSVTKQISSLLLKTSRLNVLVDKLQKKTNFGEKNSENGFRIIATSDAYNECLLKVMDNNDSTGLNKIPLMENDEASAEENSEYKSDNECCNAGANINLSPNVNVRTVGSLPHNAVQYYESNINPNPPLGENCETKFFKKLGTCSDEDICKNLSTKSTGSDESILDENTIEEDNPLSTFNKEKVNESSFEIDNCNTSSRKTKIRKNESGYKSRTIEIQNDNRVSFHKSSGGKRDENVSKTGVQREDSNVLNIKPTEHITEDTRTMMKSVTSYSSSRRPSRRRHEEDFYDEKLFDAGQPKTVREWYQYTKQITDYASARMRSGAVKLGRSPDVILVLDTSDRMTGYFQMLKSAALQYVYGIKQSSECGDLEIGIGLAVFGKETRLVQEATNDYELVIELLGNLKPEGDAHILAGLLMGYAGVVSCFIGCYKDIVLQAHMIVFTNGSSEKCKLSTENRENSIFALHKSRIPSDINGVIDEIVSTTTRIFYVPIGGNQCNNTLEQVVGKTNGKIIPVNEMYRLIRMIRVMLLAIQIASDIRYLKNQSRDEIRRRISNHSSLDDTHEDCLDMVPDFINPFRFDNKKGLFLELDCHTLTLGDRVRRGPDWTFSDQDLGLPGTAVGYERKDIGWVIVEWDHGAIYHYPYDEQMGRLALRKVNEPRVLVNELIAVGCRVVRGQDWKYGDHDGGKGTMGTVLGVREEGKVVVRWDRKNIGIYKIGYKGRFEVKLIDNFSNDGFTIGCEDTDMYGNGEDRYNEPTPGKHQNAPYTMNTNECGPEDYIIPIYSETSISAIWEHKKGSQWEKYPLGVNVKIEKAYQRKKTGKIIIEMDHTTGFKKKQLEGKINYEVGEHYQLKILKGCANFIRNSQNKLRRYIIHFSRMVQVNAHNKTEIAVRRRD